MTPLCNGFYLFPLSRAVNSNSLIFDPSEFKIGLYWVFIQVYSIYCSIINSVLLLNNSLLELIYYLNNYQKIEFAKGRW